MDDTAAVQPSLADFETRTFGDVTLVRGDCLEVMPFLPAKALSVVFADLPYANTDNHWDCKFNLDDFWKHTCPLLTRNGCVLMTATQPFATSLINANSKMFRYDMIMRKTTPVGFLNAKKMPLRLHEHILVFYRNLPTYNPQKWLGPVAYKARRRAGSNTSYGKKIETWREANNGERYPVSVLDVKSIKRQDCIHPTQKPVALLEWLIRTYTNDGDTILDPVAGSATTAIAAMNVGNRKVICIEKDPTYFEVMTKRVADHQKALANAQA